MSDRIKVIYIAGDNYCGSTIVGRLLGQLNDVFMAGEIRDLWSRGVKSRVLCSCGQPMPDCEVWSKVLDLSPPKPRPDTRAMINLQWEPTRSRHIDLAILPGRNRRQASRWTDLIPYTGRLYRSIVEVTGCQVIVDTSKAPLYALMLRQVPEIDLRYIHLVRDPRGSAYSWDQHRKQRAERRRSIHSGRPSNPVLSMRWVLLNWLCNFVGRDDPDSAMRLRYEDFLRDAQGGIEQIARFAEVPMPDHPLVQDNEVEIQPGHVGLGNPGRMNSGKITLRHDDRWMKNMSGLDKFLITAMTLPACLRYGYLGQNQG